MFKMLLRLLDEGNTVPFIARYRKEETGGLWRWSFKKVYWKINLS